MEALCAEGKIEIVVIVAVIVGTPETGPGPRDASTTTSSTVRAGGLASVLRAEADSCNAMGSS